MKKLIEDVFLTVDELCQEDNKKQGIEEIIELHHCFEVVVKDDTIRDYVYSIHTYEPTEDYNDEVEYVNELHSFNMRELKTVENNYYEYYKNFPIQETLREAILNIASENKFDLSKVEKISPIRRQTVSRLLHPYKPSGVDKNTLFMFMFCMSTNLSQAERLLNAGGYTFCKTPRDVLVRFCVENRYSFEEFWQILNEITEKSTLKQV